MRNRKQMQCPMCDKHDDRIECYFCANTGYVDVKDYNAWVKEQEKEEEEFEKWVQEKKAREKEAI